MRWCFLTSETWGRDADQARRWHHVHTTLRAALNAAVREGVIVNNPAAGVQLLAVTRQRTTAGYTIHEGPPKSATGRRIVALDCSTVQVLRLHRRRQQRQRERRDNAAKP